MTAADPRTLRAVQFKGRTGPAEAATTDDRAAVVRFCESFFGVVEEVEGTDRALLERLVPHDFVACTVAIESLYDQAPGPGAGAELSRDDIRDRHPMQPTPSLEDLRLCFEGAIPAVVATAAADGTPNVTFLSRVRLVDDERIALSNQFFSKTTQNLIENPRASVMLMDPVDYRPVPARARLRAH